MKTLKIILLILSVIIMFSACKKAANVSKSTSTQSGQVKCKFLFSKSMLTDSTVCIYSFGNSIKQKKLAYSLSDSTLVNIGDTVKCQMVNYGSQTSFDNHITVTVDFGNVLKTLIPTPNCTNCVYSSNATYWDANKVTQIFTMVVN